MIILSRSDCDLIGEIIPVQLAIEMSRSQSLALISDAMRALTDAHAADKLSKDAYIYMISTLADVMGREQ